MYPLKAVLVGCDETEHPDLRHELDNLGVVIEAAFDDARSATAQLGGPSELIRMFLMHLRTPQDLRQLERLNDHFAGRPIVALVNDLRDSTMVVQAMRAGAAQVVSLPIVPDDFHQAMDRIEFSSALEAIMRVVTQANRYIEAAAPWKLAKDPAMAARLSTVLRLLAEVIRIVSLTLEPFMPSVAGAIWAQLGCGAAPRRLEDAARWGLLTDGQAIGPHPVLFPRKETKPPT